MKGVTLKKILAIRGYNQVFLAEKLNTNRVNIAQFLRSDDLKSGFIENVATALNLSIFDLYELAYKVEGLSVPTRNTNNQTNKNNANCTIINGNMASVQNDNKECDNGQTDFDTRKCLQDILERLERLENNQKQI